MRETLRIAHQSMQFSDPPEAHKKDAKTLFDYARDHDVRIVTTTESADPSVWIPLRAQAHAHEYMMITRQGSVTIAVRRDSIKPFSVDTGYIEVVASDEGESQHQHGSRGIGWLMYDDVDFGTITQGVMHQLTNGRKPGQPNYKLNRRFGPAARGFAKKHGEGNLLCFLNGDMNLDDKHNDVYRGAPFTTAWDALEHWEPTLPFGTYDVIGGYNEDGRVQWTRVKSFKDGRVLMRADHYLVVADASVRKLKGR